MGRPDEVVIGALQPTEAVLRKLQSCPRSSSRLNLDGCVCASRAGNGQRALGRLAHSARRASDECPCVPALGKTCCDAPGMIRLSVAIAAWLAIAVVLASPQTKANTQPAPIDRTWRDGSGRVALVSDTLVEPSATGALRSFASQFGDWRFVGPLSAAYRRPDVITADEAYERRRPLGLEGFRFATDLHRPWFGQTTIARAFASAADRIQTESAATSRGPRETTTTVDAVGNAAAVGGMSEAWHVLHAAVVNIRRGDAVRVAAACPPVAHGRSSPVGCGEPSPGGGNGTRACPGDVVALLMLTTATAQSKQDDYGEVTLFERLPPGAPGPADGVDSFAGARLRAGRAFVFGCETPFRTAPPSVSTPKAILLLRVVLTRDAQRAAVAQRAAHSARVLQGNSLPERLGFPAVLFDADVVRPQEEVIAAMEAEETASLAADAAGGRDSSTQGSAPDAAGVDSTAKKAAEAALEAAVQRTKAAKAAAQATIDDGDEWALPLSRRINLTAHEARVFETTGKRRVHLFDGLFADEESQALLRKLRDHVVTNASYSFDDSTNDEIADDTDNGEASIKSFARFCNAPTIPLPPPAVLSPNLLLGLACSAMDCWAGPELCRSDQTVAGVPGHRRPCDALGRVLAVRRERERHSPVGPHSGACGLRRGRTGVHAAPVPQRRPGHRRWR